MRPKEAERAKRFENALLKFTGEIMPLPGLVPDGHLACLVEQLVESRRRIEFVEHLANTQLDPKRADPHSALFDPLRAAALQYRKGNLDEAYWLTFLAVHFGKHRTDKWAFVRDVYGRLGGPGLWSWASVCADRAGFEAWFVANQAKLAKRHFSNHRRYETLNPTAANSTPAILQSYIDWIGPNHRHIDLITAAHLAVGQNPTEVFDHLYRGMKVKRFGRLGKFDFLAMLGKLGIAPIVPGSAFLWDGATGPLRGARLLFGGNSTAKLNAKILDGYLIDLDGYVGVGMQALEDSLCNWQKSPAIFQSFKG